MLLSELGCPQEEPTLIWEDNKTCSLLSENESSSTGRWKHNDTKFRFVTEVISDDIVKILYNTSSQVCKGGSVKVKVVELGLKSTVVYY